MNDEHELFQHCSIESNIDSYVCVCVDLDGSNHL